MAFQKGNQTRTVAADKARVYLPAAIPVGNITSGTSNTTVLTFTVPFEFQGPGQVFVTIPGGQAALANGLELAEAMLLAPSTGSYSAGNHPRVSVKISNDIGANVNQTTALDLFCVQY